MSWFASGSAIASASGSSAANFSSYSSTGNVALPKEYDKEKRQANVYLFTRPVGALPSAESEAFHHWALVFAFEDGSWRTVEGFGDGDMKLVPNYSKESPKEDGTYRLIGQEVLSPWDLREYAFSNEANGKPYNETLHNCQDWVMGLAKKFSQAVVEKLKNFDTIKKVDPFLAFVGGSLCASRNTLASSLNYSSRH